MLGIEIQKANKVKNPDTLNNKGSNEKQKVTVLGNNYFLWFPKYIFNINGTDHYKNYYHFGDIKTKKVILLVGGANFIDEMARNNETNANVDGAGELLFSSIRFFVSMSFFSASLNIRAGISSEKIPKYR